MQKKGTIIAINLRSSLVKEKALDANVGRKEVDRLIEWAKQQGMGGLTWMRMTDEGLSSNIVKYFDKDVLDELAARLQAECGDMCLFLAGTTPSDPEGGRAAPSETGPGQRSPGG